MLDKLPTDILLSNIFTFLDSSSLNNLAEVSKYFNYLISNDEVIWKNLCLNEFNISQDSTFRYNGWRKFYNALKFHTKLYVWGENNDRRLGIEEEEQENTTSANQMFRPVYRGRPMRQSNVLSKVNFPYELSLLSSKSIIDLSVGGWSFHALDITGSVWTWGTFHQELMRHSSVGTTRLLRPTLLQGENRVQDKVTFKSISSGRTHVIGLARDGTVWHWTNHIMLQRVQVNTDSSVVQVVANWSNSSILTKDGSIYILPAPDLITQSELLNEPLPTIITQPGFKADEHLKLENDQFVQIAGLDGCTLALTKFGRVIKIHHTSPEQLFASPMTSATELVHFSSQQNELNDRFGVMKRFITGSFVNFAVYTKDKVMIGNRDATRNTQPVIIPELENQDICKVSFGDYHTGALTNEGKIITWGGESSGALGRGPMNKYMDHPPGYIETLNDHFVFNIGFGGWQSSALAIAKDE